VTRVAALTTKRTRLVTHGAVQKVLDRIDARIANRNNAIARIDAIDELPVFGDAHAVVKRCNSELETSVPNGPDRPLVSDFQLLKIHNTQPIRAAVVSILDDGTLTTEEKAELIEELDN